MTRAEKFGMLAAIIGIVADSIALVSFAFQVITSEEAHALNFSSAGQVFSGLVIIITYVSLAFLSGLKAIRASDFLKIHQRDSGFDRKYSVTSSFALLSPELPTYGELQVIFLKGIIGLSLVFVPIGSLWFALASQSVSQFWSNFIGSLLVMFMLGIAPALGVAFLLSAFYGALNPEKVDPKSDLFFGD